MAAGAKTESKIAKRNLCPVSIRFHTFPLVFSGFYRLWALFITVLIGPKNYVKLSFRSRSDGN